MTTALLIIDVQDALTAGDYAAFESQRVIERINLVSQQARRAGAAIFLIQHEEGEGPLVHGEAGWQLAPALQTQASDIRLRKTACDAFHKTDLPSLLQAHGAAALVVCGLQTEYCVDTTVRRALALGYPVTLVADAHTTLDNRTLSAAQIIAHHNEILGQLGSFGPRVQVVDAAQVQFGVKAERS